MKMSDVFELPMQVRLDESEGGFEMFSQDKDDHDFSTLYSLWSDLPDAQAAAHAINCHDELVELATACLGWIDSVPQGVELPAMPGFDRDWADNVMEKAK